MESARDRSILSRIAKGNGHCEDSPYFDGWRAYDRDPFHVTENPDGVIQMGLAENQLSFDLIQEWVSNHPAASICTAHGVDQFRDVATFQDYHGLPEFRTAVAQFMAKVRGNKVTFDPDRVVMSGGATGAHEMIAFCLADPGDAFLVPTPYYPGFDRDLRWRTGTKLVPVECENFKVTAAAVDVAYTAAVSSGVRVKALLITNPSNPLGTTIDRDNLGELLRYTAEKKIHLVCDEIYAATVTGRSQFISISEIMEGLEEEAYRRDLVHIVYSLSKDMGFPGFRVGIVYSYNDEVVSCARRMSSFGLVSTQTQLLVASMLSDEEFVDHFLSESAARLGYRRRMLETGLAQVEISCLKANAGLFSWMDLRKLLNEPTMEAETALWRVIINEVKLNVSPGSSFHCTEPGWFRVCFANIDDDTLQVALRRIRRFMVRKGEEGGAGRASKRRCRNGLQLSLPFRRLEDATMISPQSPISQEPLIRT